MNKIVFPALLAATIMVAGAFAFMPVEQASTVHLTITSSGETVEIGTGVLDAGEAITVTNFDVGPYFGGYFIVDVTAIGGVVTDCDIDLLVVESNTAQDIYAAGSALIIDGSGAPATVATNYVLPDADTDLLTADTVDVTVSLINDGTADGTCNATADVDITVSIVGKSSTG